jgi:cysteine desulfurase family protein (TIGR01976 family)
MGPSVAHMAYDVARVRAHFPQVETAAFFDGPGGSQTPRPVAQAVADALLSPLSNRGSLTASERNASSIVDGCREAVADLLGASPTGVVYGRSFTQLTFDFSRTLAQEWGPGDEVVVSRLDHDSNVRPWVIAAERAGATVRWLDLDPTTGELAPVSSVLSERTRLIAVTGASNLIGTMPSIPDIAREAHAVGALVYVDAVHLTPHATVSLADSGADVIGCSPYKFLGPHCGVLAARPELLGRLHPDKLVPATDAVPERFELGTLPYELMAGVTAAVDFLASLVDSEGTRRERLAASMTALAAHEDALRTRLEDGLRELPGVTLWSRAARRTPTVTATFEGRDPRKIAAHLAAHGVNAPAGTFYAHEPAKRLGLPPEGLLRMGIAPYTSEAEVDRLLELVLGVVQGQ